MKFLLIIFPTIFMVVWSILASWLAPMAWGKIIEYSFYAAGGITVGILIKIYNERLAKKFTCPPPTIGTFKQFTGGLLLGLIISFLSAFLFWLIEQPDVTLNVDLNKSLFRFLGSISPAVAEEFSFRGTIVHFARFFWGTPAGLASGSLPFGLLHLIGRFFGSPVDALQVIGISVAGLMLSLSYLRFGLLNAIAIHWIWNSLVGTWSDIFQLPKGKGIALLEGAWTTSLVLAIFCLIFWFLPNIKTRSS